MYRLVDGLLALARADKAASTATAEAVDLRAMLAERRDTWLPVAEERGVHLVVEAGPSLPGLATPDRVSQVLDNLLDNALEVAPGGSTIRLAVVATPTGPTIHVADQGPGMTPDQRERALRPVLAGPRGHGLERPGPGHRAEAGAGGRRPRRPAGGPQKGGLDAVVQHPPVPAR